MPAIHVRDVPEEVLDALERRAARHERSMQEELRHLLATVAREEPAGEPLPPIELKLSDPQPSSSWRREEIYGGDGR
ncbi:MAG: FitA-like ribbon-helix-helix domain-containing protein [Thermoanaerobaculia bacterium]